MANQEVSITEKLKRLYTLQLIDSQIDEINTLRGELPMEVQDLEDEIEGIKTRISKLETNIQELDSDAAKHNFNIKESEALIIKYKSQMDNVKNNREFDALTKELELQHLEIKLSQKKIREIQHFLEKKNEMLEGVKLKLESKIADLDAKKVALEKIISKTEKEERKLQKQSDKQRKLIDVFLLKAYDKTRRTYRNKLAVVNILRNSCGGCFNSVPPQKQLEVELSKKIIACEHCGRVIVSEHILSIEEGEEAAS